MKLRAAMAALLALSAPIAGGADLPCGPAEKACAMKALRESPVKRSDFWRDALARPPAERIGAAPGELVQLLQLDVIANEYPNKPHASQLDPAFLADVRRAFDGLPAAVKKLLEA